MMWMALLKEDVPDFDLQKYSGSRLLCSKRSAVNPFWRDVFSSFVTFFHHLPDFQKGASHKLYPNFSKNQSCSTTKSKSKERLFQDKFGEG